MLGAIAGDVIGSPFEFNNYKNKDFPLFQKRSKFTDDTVLTVATADALMNNSDYATVYRSYARKYPGAGYGGMFAGWVRDDEAGPYNSFGNGSAMRISPVGLQFGAEADIDDVLAEAERSAAVSHNHEKGVAGAQAIAVAIWMAKTGKSKEEIKDELDSRFDYDLDMSVEECRELPWKATCEGSIPQAIIAFLVSENFEDAIRTAVSMGGDTDTIAAMTGSIAHAFYKKIPYVVMEELLERVPSELIKVITDFESKVGFDTEIDYSDFD